jgi:hypothetical protein
MPAADSGLLAALLLAGGVTAVVAIAMMIVKQHRAARLTASRGVLSVTLGLSVLALAGLGIVALSPVSAQATDSQATDSRAIVPASSTSSSDVLDVQLPTR